MSEKTLIQKMAAIQGELKAPKNQYNNFGKYKYRSQEDILEAVKPLLKKYGCTIMITDEIKEIAGIPFVEATVAIIDLQNTKEGKSNSLNVVASAGIDINKKGMDVSQTFGAASSYARKYALNGMFLIDDNKDTDDSNQHEDRLPQLTDKHLNAMLASINQGNYELVEKRMDSYTISPDKKNILDKAIKEAKK